MIACMKAIDPMCGMTVDPATALSAERGGETFYFCSEVCRRKFVAQHDLGTSPASAISQSLPDSFSLPVVQLGGPAVAAETAIDPVCGMTVDPRTAITGERDGKTYYFCCEHCRRKFLGETGAGAAPEQDTCCGTSRAAYYCPMCAGVEGDTPGDCPKCGMALEPTGLPTGAAKTVWTCPMHPEIEQDAPGACPKCGMDREPKHVTTAADDHADVELRSMSRRM
jgi:Cu+-exporting ATPase